MQRCGDRVVEPARRVRREVHRLRGALRDAPITSTSRATSPSASLEVGRRAVDRDERIPGGPQPWSVKYCRDVGLRPPRRRARSRRRPARTVEGGGEVVAPPPPPAVSTRRPTRAARRPRTGSGRPPGAVVQAEHRDDHPVQRGRYLDLTLAPAVLDAVGRVAAEVHPERLVHRGDRPGQPDRAGRDVDGGPTWRPCRAANARTASTSPGSAPSRRAASVRGTGAAGRGPCRRSTTTTSTTARRSAAPTRRAPGRGVRPLPGTARYSCSPVLIDPSSPRPPTSARRGPRRRHRLHRRLK